MADLRRCRELQSLTRSVAPQHQVRPGAELNSARTDLAEFGSDPAAGSGASGFRKVQFNADAIGIVEKELRVAGARHDALAEFDAFRLQMLAHAVHIGRRKGDVVKPTGILVLPLSAAHHNA